MGWEVGKHSARHGVGGKSNILVVRDEVRSDIKSCLGQKAVSEHLLYSVLVLFLLDSTVHELIYVSTKVYGCGIGLIPMRMTIPNSDMWHAGGSSARDANNLTSRETVQTNARHQEVLSR